MEELGGTILSLLSLFPGECIVYFILSSRSDFSYRLKPNYLSFSKLN